MQTKLIVLLTLTCLVFPGSPAAQSQREVLTNAKIIELVRLGLSEVLIVAKINRSDCQCDTSTAAISKLKASRVSDAIILAMMDAQDGHPQQPSVKSGTKGRSVSESQQAKAPAAVEPDRSAGTGAIKQITEPGIYLFENGKMTAIEPTVFTGTKSSFLGPIFTYGIKSSKIRAVVRGRSANLQIASSRPEFYFAFGAQNSDSAAIMAGGVGSSGATSPAEFILVQMRVKENSREAILGKASAFGISTNAPDEVIREYSFEKLKPGTYKVVPRQNLEPGEYCFYTASGGGRGGKLFDFSVK